MLVLFETAAGYGLFKVLDEAKIVKLDASEISEKFETPESASKV